MRGTLSLILLFVLGVTFTVRADDDHAARTARAERALAQVAPADGPAIAVAVVSSDGPVFVRYRGFADLTRGVATAPGHAFDLASLSKQFVATAALRLAARGELDLDAPVATLVPELARRAVPRPIRVRDLMFHTSGLPDYLDDLEETEDVSSVWVAQVMSKKKLEFPTGTGWEYSNTNYALLGLVVERAAKARLDQVLAAEVFEPLGMKDTSFLYRADQVIAHRVQGYAHDDDDGWQPARMDCPQTGDGNVFTTLPDLIAWDGALRGNGLDPAFVATLFTSGRLDDGSPVDYGAGWIIEAGPPRLVAHSGAWVGTSTSICRDLDAGLTSIVLWSADDQDADALADALLDAFRP